MRFRDIGEAKLDRQGSRTSRQPSRKRSHRHVFDAGGPCRDDRFYVICAADIDRYQGSESLYRLIDEQIVHLYYDKNDGVPRRWIQMMKASIETVAPFFNTDRMLAE